jgi:hypothetical protein
MKLNLFWAIVIILVVLFLIGEVINLGNLIYILLVIGLITVVYRLFTGRNVVTGK